MKKMYESPKAELQKMMPLDIIALSLDAEGTGEELEWDEIVTKK